MAMGTLQSNLDEVPAGTAVVPSKTGNTDAIRVMLREQKKECSELHANIIFKEFRDKQRKSMGFTGHLQATSEAPPVIDDLEAEGQMRLFDLIKRAATELEAAPAGVWANFGKPYACLGELVQLEGSAAALLPKLNRDELISSQGQRRSATKRLGSHSAAATAGAVPAGAAGGLGTKHTADNTTAVTEGGKQSSSPEKKSPETIKEQKLEELDAEAARLLRHKTVTKFTTIDRLEASFPAAAVKQADARRKAAKAGPNKFFNKSLAEADVNDASGSYRHYDMEKQPLPGYSLVQKHQAAALTAQQTAAAAGGTHTCSSSPAVGYDTGGDSKSVFITQRAAAGAAPGSPTAALSQQHSKVGSDYGSSSSALNTARSQASRASSPNRSHTPRRLTISCTAVESKPGSPDRAAARRSMANGGPNMRVTAPRCTMSLHDSSADLSAFTSTAAAGPAGQLGDYASGSNLYNSSSSVAAAAAGGDAAQKPEFKVLTELPLQPPGDANNPVTSWHVDFVKARYAGYTSLQETLWQRSQERAAVRSDPAGRIAVNRSLMEQLETAQGKLAPGWIPGTHVKSPFAGSRQSKAAAAAAAAAAEGQAAAGTRQIKQSEVEVIEHFYDALCGLVEKQRLSDPLSLMVVHKVKALLEGGTFLQLPLLQQVINHIADFVKSCGLVRYNRFALPLLTFIRKCVGVSPAELQAMAAAAGVTDVLYEQQQQQQTTPVTSGPSANAPAAAAVAGSRLGADGMMHVITVDSHAEASTCTSPTAAAAGNVPRDGPAAGSSRLLVRESSKASPRAISNHLAAESSSSTSVRRNSGRIASNSGMGELGASPSMVRRSSRLETAAAVPPIPIDAAMAAAAADIEEAVHSAPQSQRAAGSTGPGEHIDGQAVRIRVPGVAAPVASVQQAAAESIAASSSNQGAGGTRAAAEAAGQSSSTCERPGVQLVDAEPLPDLGADSDGRPVSRRARNIEGMVSWTGSPRGAFEGQ